MGGLVVPFDDVVLQEINGHASLQDVIPAGMESRVGEVVAETKSLLRIVLNAEEASDSPDFLTAAAGRAILEFPRRQIGICGRRIPPEALESEARFVQQRSAKVAVLENPEGDVLARIDGRLSSHLPTEVPDISLVPVVETELER